jgi:hypothetical protein
MRRALWTAAVCCFALLACLEAPLGSIAAAKIDHRLDGLWLDLKSDKVTAWMCVPVDDHIDCVVYNEFYVKDGEPTLHEAVTFRAWVTSIAGSTFISLEPVAQILPEYRDKHFYYSARLDFGESGTLDVRWLRYKFKDIAHIKDADSLTRFVEENARDPLLLDEPEPYHRPDPSNAVEKAIMHALLGGP